ncbi:nucleotidyltransferase family protein [Shewanella sp.]|uniref:nucleotidyltransferase family protein n=1 Tax=Shewanella sp. TaxID=50422 RepID=UPI003D0B2A7B
MTGLKPKVMIALLAAGESRRFGGAKLAEPLSQSGAGREDQQALDEPLILAQYRTLELVAEALDASLVVITGGHQQRIEACLPTSALKVHNPDWPLGLAHSIATAAQYAKAQGAESLLIALGDQPALASQDYLALFSARRRENTRVCAYYELTLGAPALFCHDDFKSLMALSGDRGAKALLTRLYREGQLIALAMPEAAVDIDTRSQLEAYRARC